RTRACCRRHSSPRALEASPGLWRMAGRMTADDPRPLAGLVIVDLTRILAGPFCTLVLGNLGARVIKVERPDGGDGARSVGPFVGGKSLYFASPNHGKESIAVGLKRAADRA